MTAKSDLHQNEPDPEGLRAARAYAGWKLGYRSWADKIIDAYLNPETAMENLRREKSEGE